MLPAQEDRSSRPRSSLEHSIARSVAEILDLRNSFSCFWDDFRFFALSAFRDFPGKFEEFDLRRFALIRRVSADSPDPYCHFGTYWARFDTGWTAKGRSLGMDSHICDKKELRLSAAEMKVGG